MARSKNIFWAPARDAADGFECGCGLLQFGGALRRSKTQLFDKKGEIHPILPRRFDAASRGGPAKAPLGTRALFFGQWKKLFQA
jgi:hypothetical protein